MGGRWSRAAVVVWLILPALVVPMATTGQELETAKVAIVDPERGERFSDEFTLAWEFETGVTVDEVDLRLEYLCDRTDEIHVVADRRQLVNADGPQRIAVDPAVAGPSGGLPDCDTARLRLFVVPSPTAEVLKDTVSIVLDHRPSSYDLQIEDYKQAKGKLSLGWTDRDGNEVPTVLAAIDTETDTVLQVSQGLDDEARETIDLNATELAGPWRNGTLGFEVDCEETVGWSCDPDDVTIPIPSGPPGQIGLSAEAEAQIRFGPPPSGECRGSKRLEGTVQVQSGTVDAEEALERVEVKHTADGEDRTGGVYVPADPGSDGRWSTFVYEYVCSEAGLHDVSVRPVFQGGIPGDAESTEFTLEPPTVGTYEDLSIERVDASACTGNATGELEVVGSVSGVDMVEALFVDDAWQPVATVSDPVEMAEIADEADVRFPAKADAAFRYRVACPGPGTHKLMIRALTVADSTETWEELIEVEAGGPGGGVELDVAAGATRLEDLPGERVRAHFNAEALGTAGRPGGLKQLSIDIAADPGDARLSFEPGVDVPALDGDLLVVETFDLHVEDGSGREIPVVKATLEYRSPSDSLARASASFADPTPRLADRDPDEGRWRMVDAASTTDAGDGEVVRYEMSGDDLFSPFAMTYGPASGGPAWAGPSLGQVLAGLSTIGQVVFLAGIGLVAVLAGLVAAGLVRGREPPIG